MTRLPRLLCLALPLLVACDPTEEDDAPVIDVDPDVIVRLADRLADVQMDDGSFGWERELDAPVETEGTGYQNVTGVTALGLECALGMRDDAAWEGAVEATAGYFDLAMDDLRDDPSDADNSLSSPTWTFLTQESMRTDDVALAGEALDALDALVDARDAAYGDDDGRLDGLLNHLVARRASIPGIIPWDAALWVEALDEAATLDPTVGEDADEVADWLQVYLEGTFLPAWDADPTLAYGDISLALPLRVLAARGDDDLTDGLEERLEALVDADGRVSNGSDDDGPVQASSYALLAFLTTGNPAAVDVADWIEAQVDDEGVIANDERGVENFEVQGEALRALCSGM